LPKLQSRAARWGTDQQLELDAKWLDHNALNEAHLKIAPMGKVLKEAMRPKPPSLKAQALAVIDDYTDPHNPYGTYLDDKAITTIRRAINQLPDDQV